MALFAASVVNFATDKQHTSPDVAVRASTFFDDQPIIAVLYLLPYLEKDCSFCRQSVSERGKGEKAETAVYRLDELQTLASLGHVCLSTPALLLISLLLSFLLSEAFRITVYCHSLALT